MTGPATPTPAPEARSAPAVLITGATGFIGRALVAQWRRAGRPLIVLTRDLRQARANFGTDVWVVDSLDALPSETRLDAIINLAGARVLGLPWSAVRRRELLASRISVTQAVVALIGRLQQRPRVLVSASAVGYYGARDGSLLCTEDSPPKPGEFQSDLCVAIEHEASRAQAFGVRVVRLRLGVVLGRGDGAYPMLARGSRLGLGAVLGTGRQPAPWIHLADALGLIDLALAHSALNGALNAVAPSTPTQAEFAQAMAASFGTRVRLRIPAWPLRRLAGEMATLLLDGQNVRPQQALAAGYQYRFATLSEAFADLRGRPASA